jgi:hypothetical protein
MAPLHPTRGKFPTSDQLKLRRTIPGRLMMARELTVIVADSIFRDLHFRNNPPESRRLLID